MVYLTVSGRASMMRVYVCMERQKMKQKCVGEDNSSAIDKKAQNTPTHQVIFLIREENAPEFNNSLNPLSQRTHPRIAPPFSLHL